MTELVELLHHFSKSANSLLVNQQTPDSALRLIDKMEMQLQRLRDIIGETNATSKQESPTQGTSQDRIEQAQGEETGKEEEVGDQQ